MPMPLPLPSIAPILMPMTGPTVSESATSTLNGKSLPVPWTMSASEQTLFWKQQLCSILPTQSQCDLLLCYYLENCNWIFQTLHVPSFRKQYAQFWNADVDDVDLMWLSLLLTIISLSALYVPPQASDMVGLQSTGLRNMAHVWHSASRQALHAGGFEAKPCLTQLQTFCITQLYWYATNKTEILSRYASSDWVASPATCR
jgi:hypothetical protein